MHQPEEACSPGVATCLAKRRSMDGAVPSTPPSSGKGKRRDAPSDYRADVSRALDLDVPAGSSGATDEEMQDRSFRESRSVSSDDADAREDIAAVAREAAVDRKVRVPSARQTPPLSIDDSVSETRERTKHATSRCFPSVRQRGGRNRETRGRFFSFFRGMVSVIPKLPERTPLDAPTDDVVLSFHDTRPTSQRRDDEEASAAFARLLGDRNARFRTDEQSPISAASSTTRA